MLPANRQVEQRDEDLLIVLAAQNDADRLRLFLKLPGSTPKTVARTQENDRPANAKSMARLSQCQ
jgi:hypothetical protein